MRSPEEGAIPTCIAERPEAGSVVAIVMERWPETAPIFMRLRMACVGCDVAGFETVAEAAAAYGIAVDRLVAELQAAVMGRDPAGEAG